MDSSAPGSQLRDSITEAQQKIESIIDAAEDAARDIRERAKDDAEDTVRRALEDSAGKLAAITAPLIERIENLRVEAAALTHEIDTATVRLRELTAEAPVPGAGAAPGEPQTRAGAEEPSVDSGAGPRPTAYPGAAAQTEGVPPEEAYLRATQMAVSGSSRTEISEALRAEFGLDDPNPVVDEILGQSS